MAEKRIAESTQAIGQFCEKVKKSFNKKDNSDFLDEITDYFFLYIELDVNLSDEYDDLVRLYGKELVNTEIGRLVKDIYFLANKGECTQPKSSLIKTYTRHCK